MTLDHGIVGDTYIVEALHLPQNMERRLQALGMIKGTKVSVLNNKNCRHDDYSDAQYAVGPRQGDFITY